MHTLSFACKLHFAVSWTCPSSCPWWGAKYSCLTSNTVDFSFWNWVQATAIKVVFRHGKLKTAPSSSNVDKHCEEVNRNVEFCHKNSSLRNGDENNSSLNQCKCRNNIFVQKFFAEFHLVFRHIWCQFHLISDSIILWLSFRNVCTLCGTGYEYSVTFFLVSVLLKIQLYSNYHLRH